MQQAEFMRKDGELALRDENGGEPFVFGFLVVKVGREDAERLIESWRKTIAGKPGVEWLHLTHTVPLAELEYVAEQMERRRAAKE